MESRLPLPHGGWLTQHSRYYEYLRFQLEDLLACQEAVDSNWPEPGVAFIGAELYPDLHRLCRRRDATADSVVVFAAMTVEATINYYGARELGADTFEQDYERLPLVRKLRALIKACEGLELEPHHPLIEVTQKLGARRNALVHPKVRQVFESYAPSEHAGTPAVKKANEVIKECDDFLERFFEIAKSASGLDPRP
ncbi:MAG: hypothetical protein M3O61_19285 [Gemmatimonadota bacterium]|nr:hypothetical protein [Gemmatimonadota bacterium]